MVTSASVSGMTWRWLGLSTKFWSADVNSRGREWAMPAEHVKAFKYTVQVVLVGCLVQHLVEVTF